MFGIGKALKKAVGGDSGVLGGIIGAALATYTGGMSLAWGASLGAGGATYLKTGDLNQALGAGVSAYGLGSLTQAATGWGTGAATTSTGTGAVANTPASKLTTAQLQQGVGKIPQSAMQQELAKRTAAEAAAKAAAAKTTDSWFNNPYTKAGLGTLYMAGAMEKPNFPDPISRQSSTSDFYAQVAANGGSAYGLQLPPSLMPPGRERLMWQRGNNYSRSPVQFVGG